MRGIDETLKLAREFRGCMAELENRDQPGPRNAAVVMQELIAALTEAGFVAETEDDRIDEPSTDPIVERGGSLFAALYGFANTAQMVEMFRQQAPQALPAVLPAHQAVQPSVYRALVLFIRTVEEAKQ